MHYKIKVLVIDRFNYYEIMFINYVLIVYDAYKVNKLVEAKLSLRHWKLIIEMLLCLCHHKCDVIDTNWVDAYFITSIITMNYEKEKDIYWLDCLDANSLDEFVTNKICNCNFFHFNYIPCFHFCYNLQNFLVSNSITLKILSNIGY